MTERYGAYGLAGNPAAPAGVLLRLLALNDRSITHRLSYHPALTGEVAEAMLTHPERWVRHLLAESFTAAPELRARLLDGPASDAMAVAMGPHPYRIRVPPLPDGAYERLLNHERGSVRYETVGAPSTPDHVLVPLAGHADPYFRRAACRRVWHLLDAGARSALLADPDHDVRTAASLQVMDEDEERTEELVRTQTGAWHLGEVVERGRLGRALAERLVAEGVLLARLALNPTLPADLAAGLADHENPAVRLAVSARPELSEDERAAIDWRIDAEDRLPCLRWAWDARHDPETLRRCATSAHTWLRRSAAMCPELPQDCVELLAGDADFAVRLLLAEGHPEAPAELLLDLYLHGTHRAVGSLTSRPRFPAAGLARRFADAPDPRARALALRDPAATPELVERLSRDPDAGVRGTAAYDPRLPVLRLLELLADPATAMAAAANPVLPPAEMYALLDREGIPR
ncbi:hypothetical protein ACPXCO_11615 [Streptomyces cyaneofuscatus]|uniref:hypothetical protein n=1 Tax=Streptomyces TaxID=1883 RepID=UPI000978D47A|nr:MULTISPECIES: hypothetical protein [unclassified Streptomyces]ONI52836.1 hypothetical protein STIB_21800 [Streptomyces sp. IB2014 011-1]RDV50999.1 hypothetical protein DDV98_14340 [Streptomyces sp. IB2014 011-12]